MFSIPLGIITFVNFESCQNKPSSILLSDLGILILVNSGHFENAYFSITVTLSNI